MKFLPKPKEVKLLTGEHALCYDGRIVLDGRLLGNGDTYAKVLQKGIKKETGMQYDIGYGVPGRKETGAIVLELDETRKSQQYVLQVTEEEIRIQGGDGAGVLYGVQTLCQMMHEYGALLPAVRIEDEPDLPVRGYYLDERPCADTFLFKTGGRPHGVLQAEPAAALCGAHVSVLRTFRDVAR